MTSQHPKKPLISVLFTMGAVLTTAAFAALTSSLISVDALAQSTTEFFHMPAADVSEVTPHVGYRTSTIRSTPAGSVERNMNGLDRLGVTYMYGVNPLVALGADLSYSTYKTSNGGGDVEGFEPLQLFLDGQLPMSTGNLQYGLLVSFGLEKAKTNASKSNLSFGTPWDDTVASGFKIAPYLGYAFSAGRAGSFGGRVSYQIVNSDAKVDIPTGEIEMGGGARGSAALFYELKAADIPLGAALTYDWFETIEIKSPAPGSTYSRPRSLIGVKLYAEMPLSETSSFLPSFTWREKASSDDLDKLGDIRFTIAGRFFF
jgi:hypothetical protein